MASTAARSSDADDDADDDIDEDDDGEEEPDTDADESTDTDLLGCREASFRDSSYLFCSDPLPRNEAEASCESKGYDLVTINDGDEDLWIHLEAITTERWLNPGPWIGLQDSDADGVFVWNDGELADYTNWCTEEPSDRLPFVRMMLVGDWTPCWHTEMEATALEYVCELNYGDDTPDDTIGDITIGDITGGDITFDEGWGDITFDDGWTPDVTFADLGIDGGILLMTGSGGTADKEIDLGSETDFGGDGGDFEDEDLR